MILNDFNYKLIEIFYNNINLNLLFIIFYKFEYVF